MRMAYLCREGEGPSDDLADLFEEAEVFGIKTDDIYSLEHLAGKVAETEERMIGSSFLPFDPEDMLIYTPDVRDLGQVIERNRFNSAMVTDDGPIRMGDERVDPSHLIKLPYDGDSRVLYVAPHDEEDFVMIGGWAHNNAVDSVAMAFATDPPNEKRKEACYNACADWLGLERNDFEFAGIPDRELYKNKDKFERFLRGMIRKHDPLNVIIPSDGSNFDHKAAYHVSSGVCRELGVNTVVGRSVQSKYGDFVPKMWMVFEKTDADKAVEGIYLHGFGIKQYVDQVGNLMKELPEPLSKFQSKYKKRLRTYGLMPISMDHRYSVPSDFGSLKNI